MILPILAAAPTKARRKTAALPAAPQYNASLAMWTTFWRKCTPDDCPPNDLRRAHKHLRRDFHPLIWRRARSEQSPQIASLEVGEARESESEPLPNLHIRRCPERNEQRAHTYGCRSKGRPGFPSHKVADHNGQVDQHVGEDDRNVVRTRSDGDAADEERTSNRRMSGSTTNAKMLPLIGRARSVPTTSAASSTNFSQLLHIYRINRSNGAWTPPVAKATNIHARGTLGKASLKSENAAPAMRILVLP